MNRRLPSLNIISLLLACLLFSGCTTLLNATTEDPIELHPGKRTWGAFIDDEQLETIAAVNINKASPELDTAHINVVAYNGIILLTGQVSSGELRALAGSTVGKIPKVRQVFNEIQVQGKTSLLARTNDTWLTTKVKTILMANKDIDSGRIKVVTESGVVYLMGLMSQIEANRAAQVVSTTGGVQKVVKAVEYID